MLYAIMRKTVMLLLAVIGFTAFAKAQTVTGTVTDSKGDPIAGISVVVKGTSKGTSTNTKGGYSINDVVDGTTLLFSGSGFAAQSVKVVGGIASAVLEASASNLNEVVVVGYGSQKRKDVTGSVAKLTNANFNQGVVLDPAQALQGKIAGVNVTPPGGDPNGTATIRIRGNGSIIGGGDPLVVVDGVQGIDLATVPPSEIESIDVLKDASAAAIYGAKGANGVLLVTTKKGRAGSTMVQYSTVLATETVAHKVGLLDASEFRSAINTVLSPANPLLDGGGSTDWVKAISRTGFTHSHNLSVSGGAGKSNYRAAIGYYKQQGVLIHNDKENINLRLSAQQKALNDKLDVQLGVIYNTLTRNAIDYGDNANATNGHLTISGSGQESQNPFLFAYSMNPTYNVMDQTNPNNVYGGYFQPNEYASQNPVAFLNQVQNVFKEQNATASMRLEYSIIKDLKIFGFGSVNNVKKNNYFYSPTIAYNTLGTGYGLQANDNTRNLLTNAGINYAKKIGEHSFDVMGVYEYQTNTYDGFSVATKDFQFDDAGYNNLGFGSTIVQGFPRSYKSQIIQASFLGRLNYNFSNKYYATVNVRRDGSSVFGANNKWGTFPSVSLGWALIKEGFMKNVNWLSDLKLRAGYGATGNSSALRPYQSLNLVGQLSPTLVNGQVIIPFGYIQNANPYLKWETKKVFNAGLDFAVLKNRLTGSIDVYSGRSENLLYNFAVDPAAFNGGVNTIIANAGELTNKGIELGLNGVLVDKKDLHVGASFNIAHNSNKIVNLDGTIADKNGAPLKLTTNGFQNWGSIYGRGLSFSNVTRLQPGYQMGVIAVPMFDGLDADGKPKTVKNSTGGDSIQFINGMPKFTYGFGLNVRYKNFDLNAAFRGSHGGKVYDGTLTNLDNVGRIADGNNVYKDAIAHGIKSPAISNYFVENGSFLRCDNVTIGYNVPVKNNVIKSLRLYVSSNNLFLITKYKGTDPEVPSDGKNMNIENINIYPKNRSFSFGINVTIL